MGRCPGQQPPGMETSCPGCRGGSGRRQGQCSRALASFATIQLKPASAGVSTLNLAAAMANVAIEAPSKPWRRLVRFKRFRYHKPIRCNKLCGWHNYHISLAVADSDKLYCRVEHIFVHNGLIDPLRALSAHRPLACNFGAFGRAILGEAICLTRTPFAIHDKIVSRVGCWRSTKIV